MSTRYLSTVIFFICFFIFFNSKDILTAYVGSANASQLYVWLMIWSLGLLYLNNQAISSLILSSGQFKQITIGIAIASLTTLSFSIVFVKQIGVGTAAVGYLLYKSIEAIYLYSYYLPRVGKMSSGVLFSKSILVPLIIAFSVTGIVFFSIRLLSIESALLKIIISFCASSSVYLAIAYRAVLGSAERELLTTKFKLRR